MRLSTQVQDLFDRLQTPTQPRRSFLPFTPQHAHVVEALMLCAQAHVQGDFDTANQWLAKADSPDLMQHVLRIIGKVDVTIHRQTHTPAAECLIPKSRQVGMPSAAEQRRIFERDAWHCRCCGVPVVSPEARRRITARYAAARWGKRNHERHSGLFALMASLDHALPRSRGGDNGDDNLLTVCWPCQFGRMDWTYQEVDMADPRSVPAHPRLHGWEGLTQCR